LVQLYSAMVYQGPGIARRITKDLQRILASSPYANIAEAVGTG
jgi:dihydroorotate dehydrogenase